ncbi:MAG TPA: hypothetical protein PKK99_08655 [Bacteroidia bacterium]|nr:hypothetical protein [Bacteroidia bacterium]
MISFELEETQSGVEIVFDLQGIDDMIRYLTFVKDNMESIHLSIGNELEEKIFHSGNSLIRHVKLICID